MLSGRGFHSAGSLRSAFPTCRHWTRASPYHREAPRVSLWQTQNLALRQLHRRGKLPGTVSSNVDKTRVKKGSMVGERRGQSKFQRPNHLSNKGTHHSTVDALRHVNVITGGTALSVFPLLRIDCDCLSGAGRLTELAGNATFVTRGIAAESVLAAETRAEVSLLERIVDGHFWLHVGLKAQEGSAPHLREEEDLRRALKNVMPRSLCAKTKGEKGTDQRGITRRSNSNRQELRTKGRVMSNHNPTRKQPFPPGSLLTGRMLSFPCRWDLVRLLPTIFRAPR